MLCRGFFPYTFGSSGIGFGGMFFSMMFNLLIFIGLIVLAVKLFKSRPVKLNNINNTTSILDERFAKGEINEEEYLKIKAILLQKN